jgi:hypothetical protein
LTPPARQLIAKVEGAAAAASLAARPELLGLLGSAEFGRALCGCCPALQAMGAAERLVWFDAEQVAPAGYNRA